MGTDHSSKCLSTVRTYSWPIFEPSGDANVSTATAHSEFVPFPFLGMAGSTLVGALVGGMALALLTLILSGCCLIRLCCRQGS